MLKCRFPAVVGFAVLFLSIRLRAEELDVGRFKLEATDGWNSILASYPGFEFTRIEQTEQQIVAPVKAFEGSVRRTVTFRFFSPDLFRMDGTMETKKHDLSKISNRKDFSVSDISSVPKIVNKTSFSKIHNEEYVAAIDTTNGVGLGLLEQKNEDAIAKFTRKNRLAAFPSLCFDDQSFLPTDLDWNVHSAQNNLPWQKFWVKRVFRDDSTGLVEAFLIQGETHIPYSVSLDPRRKWAMVSSKSDDERGNLRERMIEYGSTEGFHPTKVLTKTNLGNSKMRIETVGSNVLTELIPSKIDRSSCYLSSFGLPEPDFSKKRGWSLFMVLPLLASITLLFGGVRWYRRRTR